MSGDCYSFITGISSYSSQLPLVYLLDTEKGAKAILPFVPNMAFPMPPLVIEIITMVFVEQNLALPGSAHDFGNLEYLIKYHF